MAVDLECREAHYQCLPCLFCLLAVLMAVLHVFCFVMDGGMGGGWVGT